MRSNARALARALRRAGATVTLTSRGHWRIKLACGAVVIGAPHSGDPHAWRNLLALLRRHGVDVRKQARAHARQPRARS